MQMILQWDTSNVKRYLEALLHPFLSWMGDSVKDQNRYLLTVLRRIVLQLLEASQAVVETRMGTAVSGKLPSLHVESVAP